MGDRLRELRVANFRSIRGEHTLSLDADVVLITGPNGAGKTSVMSAIELAVSGEISHLGLFGRQNYQANLIHRGQTRGHVELVASGSDVASGAGSWALLPSRLSGRALLDREEAKTFGERNFLSQSTMARLLDMYVRATDANAEAPLVKFARELLGLDELDSLIEGLAKSANVVNARKLSRSWETAIPASLETAAQLSSATSEVTLAEHQLHEWLDEVREAFPQEFQSQAEARDALATLAAERLATAQEIGRLQSLVTELRSLDSAVEKYELGRQHFPTPQTDLAIEDDFARFWTSKGNAARKLLEKVADTWGVTRASDQSDLKTLLTDIEETLASERARVDKEITSSTNIDLEIVATKQQLEQLDISVRRIDAEIDSLNLPARIQELTVAFMALKLHVVDNTCPLCDQDFIHGPELTLTDHIDVKITDLSDGATRGAELSEARSKLSVDAATLRLRLGEAELRRSALKDPASLTTMAINVERASLDVAHERAAVGQWVELSSRRVAQDRARANFEMLSAQGAEYLKQARELAAQVGLDIATDDLDVRVVLDRTRARAESLVQASMSKAEAASAAASQAEQHDQLVSALLESRATASEAAERSSQLQSALKEAGRRKELASRLRLLAERKRSSLVQQVFNEHLNGAWKQIFTRLAPHEPFVPQFTTRAARGQKLILDLVTTHRDGQPGPEPGAALSFGNANTAALSLFCALHYSAPRVKPWLLFDDPVQSMDDVHIANFASMVRRISRDDGKQLVIAVHERALFDYLSLELAPANQGQSLITHEIQRGSGQTAIKSTTFTKPIADGLEEQGAA